MTFDLYLTFDLATVDVSAAVPAPRSPPPPPPPPQQRKERERAPSQSSAKKEERAGPEEVATPSLPTPKKEATKLLDELFRKTKAAPCIYWLPLTEAEVRAYT